MDNLRGYLEGLIVCKCKEELSIKIDDLTTYCKKILEKKIKNLDLSPNQIRAANAVLEYWYPNIKINVSNQLLIGYNSKNEAFNIEVDIDNSIKQISNSLTKLVDNIKTIALNGDRLRTSPNQVLGDLHKLIAQSKRQKDYGVVIKNLEEVLEEHFGVKVIEYNDDDKKSSDYFSYSQSNSVSEPITTVPALVDIDTEKCIIQGKYVTPVNCNNYE